MFVPFWCLLEKLPKILCFCLFLIAGNLLASPVNWKSSPSKAEWQSFMKAKSEQHIAWMQAHTKQGGKLQDLSWEWRTAWVRACAKTSHKVCSNILQEGLFDRALVVRAESASRLGERFQGSAHAASLRLLERAYAIEQNVKSGDPLYVQFRILHAIHQIGGRDAKKLGKRLASSLKPTQNYWQKLARRA